MTPSEAITQSRAILLTTQKALTDALAKDRTRHRGALMRDLTEVRRMLDPHFPYSSQAGQDAVIDRMIGAKRGGTFVDVGGYDGTTGSNTFFFEVWRGWTGVLVEPVSSQIEKARAVRRCPCLEYAVADTDGTADFISVTEGYTQMGGLAQSYDPAILARVRQDPRHVEEKLTVRTRPLSAILIEAGLPDPDLISLDIEGGELATLKAFPFDRHKVSFWAIENNTGTPEIGAILRQNGYDLVEFCGPDEIYRRR